MKRDPLIFSKDLEERKLACQAVEDEMAYATKIHASYLLIHFPKPIILQKDLPWEKCKFKEYEFIYETEYSYDEFEQRCKEIFKWLSSLKVQYHVPIMLELEMMNRYLYKGNLLEQLLQEYTEIKLCLDTARLHVLQAIDNQFDMDQFILQYAPHTKLLHNIQYTGKRKHRKGTLSSNREAKWR